MSNGGRPPLPFSPQGGKRTVINVNLDTLESAACPSCGGNIFDTSCMTYRMLPAIQSPTGKAQLIGVPIIVCVGCSDLFLIRGDELIPAAKLQETGPAKEPA